MKNQLKLKLSLLEVGVDFGDVFYVHAHFLESVVHCRAEVDFVLFKLEVGEAELAQHGKGFHVRMVDVLDDQFRVDYSRVPVRLQVRVEVDFNGFFSYPLGYFFSDNSAKSAQDPWKTVYQYSGKT